MCILLPYSFLISSASSSSRCVSCKARIPILFSRSSWLIALHLSFCRAMLPLPLRFIDPIRRPAFVFLPFVLSSYFLSGLWVRPATFGWSFCVVCPARPSFAPAALPPCSVGPSLRSSLAGGVSPSRAQQRVSPFACTLPVWWVLEFRLFAVALRCPATTIHGVRESLLGSSGDVQGRSLSDVCFSLSAGVGGAHGMRAEEGYKRS